MDFGKALEAVKKGSKIARQGWNGKGMFVVYQRGYPQGIPCNKQTAEAWGLNEGDLFICNPYLQIKCADGSHSMWVPSINDCLAEDWDVVDFRWEEIKAITECNGGSIAEKLTALIKENEKIEEKNNGILSDKIDRLVVFDELDKKEIAVITKELITTADDSITVRLTPSH